MAAKLGLGNQYVLGVSTTTAKQRINMSSIRCLGVLLVGASGSTNITLNECNAATGGTEQALACVTVFWTYTLQSTPTVWVATPQAAGSAIAAPINGVTYFEVLDVSLSDGFNYLDVTHATGTAVYIGGGLRVGRTPGNLKLWTL